MTDANQLSTSLGHPNWTLPWQIEPLVHFLHTIRRLSPSELSGSTKEVVGKAFFLRRHPDSNVRS